MKSTVDQHPITGQFSVQNTLRYFVCSYCSSLLIHPTTLLCGFTLCYDCLPDTTNIGQGFFYCPLGQCTRVHNFDEIHTDVTTSKALEACLKAAPLQSNRKGFKRDLSTAYGTNFCLPGDIHSKTPDNFSVEEYVLSELECQICCMPLREPLTTQCGHTFCKSCIVRSADYNNKCPTCRSLLPNYMALLRGSQNHLLSKLLQECFPNLNRMKDTIDDVDIVDDTPLLVCSLAFPSMPYYLHIFEPKYRLMIRRCLNSQQKKFGMLLPGRYGQPFMYFGTMLEIRSVETLPDGRLLVNATGLYRFRVIKHSIYDGYNVGKVERIEDIDVEETSTARLSCKPSLDELMLFAPEFVNIIQEGCAPWLLKKFHITYGCIPSSPGDFSFWAASVMPIDEYEKYRLLEVNSIHKRLSMIVHWVKRMKMQCVN